MKVKLYWDLYPNDDEVDDEEWIPEVTSRGWVILTKDKNIRRNAHERNALLNAGARFVCLASSGLRGVEQAERLVYHWKTIDGLVSHRTPPIIVNVTREAVHWFDDPSAKNPWRKVKHKR